MGTYIEVHSKYPGDCFIARDEHDGKWRVVVRYEFVKSFRLRSEARSCIRTLKVLSHEEILSIIELEK